MNYGKKYIDYGVGDDDDDSDSSDFNDIGMKGGYKNMFYNIPKKKNDLDFYGGTKKKKKDPYDFDIGGGDEDDKDVNDIDIDLSKYRKEEEAKKEKSLQPPPKEEEPKEPKEEEKKKKKKKKGGFLDFLEDKFEKEEDEEREEEEKKKKEEEEKLKADQKKKEEEEEEKKRKKEEEEKEERRRKEEEEERRRKEEIEEEEKRRKKEEEEEKQRKEEEEEEERRKEEEERRKEEEERRKEHNNEEHSNHLSPHHQKEEEEQDDIAFILSKNKKPEDPYQADALKEKEAYSSNTMEEYLKKKQMKSAFEPKNDEDKKSDKKSEKKSPESIKSREEDSKDNLAAESIKQTKSKEEKKPRKSSAGKSSVYDDEYGGFDENLDLISENISRTSLRKGSRKGTERSDIPHIPTDTNEVNISERINKFLPDTSNQMSAGDSRITNNDKETSHFKIDDHKENPNIIKEASQSNITSDIKSEHNDKANKDNNRSYHFDEEPEKKNQNQYNYREDYNSQTNKNIFPSQSQNVNQNLISGQNVDQRIQDLVQQEMEKYLKSKNFENLSGESAPQGNVYKSSPGVVEANQEIKGLSRYSPNYIGLSCDIQFRKFDSKDLWVSNELFFTVSKSPDIKTKEKITTLKLESSLGEEQRRRMLLENELRSLRQANLELEAQLRKLQELKYENLDLKKNKQENEEIITSMKNDYNNLKGEYDKKIVMIEQRINEREQKISEHKISEIEKKYQVDILKKQYEIDNVKSEMDFFKTQNKALEDENTKLKSNTENEEQIKKLQNENFVLHEKNNELEKKNESLELELNKIKVATVQSMSKFSKSGSMINNAPSTRNNISESGSIVNYESNQVFPIGKKPISSLSVFDQLLYDREISSQEKLLQSYVKEIEHLNKEIAFLKTIPNAQPNPKKNNYVLAKNDPNGQGKINPSLQETAEIQIKRLQKFLLDNDNKMVIVEREFNRLQTEDTQNEITFDNYINVMKNMKVPLKSNELIEIFNNFPRIKGNCIRLNDFINALQSRSPSAYFMQSDPSYLNSLETQIIKSQNRIKELEKFILMNENECDEYKLQIENIKKENGALKTKINELNQQILNYFLYREEKNIANPDVVQIKEKIKTFEASNKMSTKEFEDKFKKYDNRMDEIKKDFDEKKNKFEEEKDKLKSQVMSLETENNKIKNELEKKEASYKTEIEALNQKLAKYKKNFNAIVVKNDAITKEKEKVLNCMRDKGISPEQITMFVNGYDDVQVLLKKIDELEKRNNEREERYRQISINANTQYMNKEIEKVTKQYEGEKKELLKLIAQRNKEINIIKTEFSAILVELEQLKNSKIKI